MIIVNTNFILSSALEYYLVSMTFIELSLILGSLFIIFLGYLVFKSIWGNFLTETRVALYCSVFYGIISVYFLDSPCNVVFLLACVCLFSACVICVFLVLLRLEERKTTLSDFEKLKNYFVSIYYSEDYFNLVGFWKGNFKQRSKTKEKNKFWEYTLLVGGSFYTLIRTRLLCVQNVYLISATFLLLLGNYFWLLIYILPLFILTVVFAIPSVKTYFEVIYGHDSLKKLGWN